MRNVPQSSFCTYYHHAVELIGRRWTGVILRAMHDGETRFSVIADSIPGLSDRLLSERLKELENEGIVVRTVIPETPVRIEYHLTEKGRSLGEVMNAIAAWSHEWLYPKDEEERQPESKALRLSDSVGSQTQATAKAR
jgi:DNA-binding HxlR family transcriptional regulator